MSICLMLKIILKYKIMTVKKWMIMIFFIKFDLKLLIFFYLKISLFDFIKFISMKNYVFLRIYKYKYINI